MRDREQVLKEIIQFAEETENIRGLVLQGSLVNPNAPVDRFSDLDPMFVVEDAAEMAKDDEWIKRFGQAISRCNETVPVGQTEEFMRMVLYEDDLKVDFGLFPKAAVKEIADYALYQVLLDKDNCIPAPTRTTEEAFYTEKPSKEQFEKRINGFLWDTTYVAKSLWRGEIYFAKFMFDLLHRYMKEVIAWHLGAKSNWENNPGVCGRYFHHQMDPVHWQKVLRTYAGSEVDDNWRALFASCELVGELGGETADLLGYDYPVDHHKRMIEYLKKIQAMEQ